MLSKIWIVSALSAVTLAVPTLPFSATAVEPPADMTILADYFKLLGSKVQDLKGLPEAPICDFSKASMPVASPTPLPPVGAGLKLKHVAIGRGIQNYTCDTTNATALPIAIGAIATLYDATCIASTFPDLLALLPGVALQFQLKSAWQKSLTPSNLVVSGHHFFDAAGTPVFDLDTTAKKLGVAPCAKNATVNAPTGAVVGQSNQGFGAVAWLKLLTKSQATGNLQEVYRVNTAGGKPPATCVGAKAAFEVQYATEYWFFEKST